MAQLLPRIARQERHALIELHDCCHARLIAFFQAMALPPDVIENALVEVLFEVWCKPISIIAAQGPASGIAALAYQRACQALASGASNDPERSGSLPAPLSSPERAVLALAHGFGCCCAEIARILGWSQAQVIAHMSSARLVLRQQAAHLPAHAGAGSETIAGPGETQRNGSSAGVESLRRPRRPDD